MKAFVAVISGVLLASPALAQAMTGPTGSGAALAADNQESAESTGASSEQTADGERRVCRRIDTGAGSRMNMRRVCRTAAEWRRMQRGN